MGRVVLRCLESGMYQIRRGDERYAYPVLLLHRGHGLGWDVVARGIGIGGFPTHRAARSWLESSDGQRWMDGLRREEDG